MEDPPAPSEDLIALLSSVELFQALPKSAIREIAGIMEEQEIPQGAILIQQEGTGESLYVVVSGRLRVSIPVEGREEVLAECGPGELVGEIAFLTGLRRSATVSALENTRVLRLTTTRYEELERRYPDASGGMTSALTRRLRRSQLGIALHGNRLFGALAEPVFSDLERELQLVTLRGGETLFRQGDAGDSLYLVIGGRLRVMVKQETGEERALAELGRGETVGEMALLGGERRSATVCAVRDTNLAQLSRAGFDRLAARHPQDIAPMFIKKIIERLRQQIVRPIHDPETLHTIAVVAASDGVDIESFCVHLSRALSEFGRCLHLDSGRFDQLLSKPGASQVTAEDSSHSLVVERLAVLEGEHRYVIYQADAGGSAWTKRSFRQADHILLVGSGSADPRPGELEERIHHMAAETRGQRMSLVLLHPDGSRLPSGTKKWLEPRRLDRHYHVRMDGEADYERLGRILTGNAIGLVLGGGFARGIAHAGVIRALSELGIPVDMIGGTSMGAIMAVEYAMGYDAGRLVKVTCEASSHIFRGDLTIPIVSFLKGHQLARVILNVVDNQDFDMEDLWVPCFCVSANLTRAKMHVHTRGSALKSVLASSRAPGMYPPIVWDGDLLVDGGILDNVPVDVMKDFSRGAKVIAVNVSPKVDPAMTADYGLGVSGWRMLLGRLNPFAGTRPVVPGLASILMRAVTFGDAGRSKVPEVGDLYLSIPLETFKINDFKRGGEMADLAYRFSLPLLTAWKSGNEGTDSLPLPPAG